MHRVWNLLTFVFQAAADHEIKAKVDWALPPEMKKRTVKRGRKAESKTCLLTRPCMRPVGLIG